MSIAKLAPEHFEEYHDWLMDEEKPPTIGDARRRAMNIAGDAILLDEQLRAETLKRMIRHCNQFHDMEGVLPTLFTAKGTIRGLPKEEKHWFKTLELNFNVTPAEQGAEQN